MNKPNILSNELDQVPKNQTNNYQGVLDSLSKEINDAFDSMYFEADDQIIDWLQEHQNELPLQEITKLDNNSSLIIELKREKADTNGGWNKAISPYILDADSRDFSRIPTFTKYKDQLSDGEVSTYLVVTKIENPKFPKLNNYSLTISQIQLPQKGALLPQGGIFYRDSISGNDFKKTMEDFGKEKEK